MGEFKLDKRLENDSIHLCDLKLCQVRLLPDGDLDWFLLVPRRHQMKDWCDLEMEDQLELAREIDLICKLLKHELNPDKLNVASLGNQVPQLHIHVIARYRSDRAWPGAAFGTFPIKEFDGERVKYWQSKLP